jgi:hypothetical protein
MQLAQSENIHMNNKLYELYPISDTIINLDIIQSILDTFRNLNSLIENEYILSQQFKNIIIVNECIGHKCIFKTEQVKKEMLFLSDTLSKLIPGLEVENMGSVLKFYYKNRKFFVEFLSFLNRGKVSIHIEFFSHEMHNKLRCNSFGELEFIDITDFTAQEFVDKLYDLLNKTFIKSCYYCGTIIY